ncbi:MAG: hypothetical protein IJU41_03075 [Clostridia bacterium]|nr:hypothetical protein [Clostridia bacterium]
MNLCYFPGANTGSGFYSLFSGIVQGGKPHYTYVLKGGPGVGKSTLMKTVAARAAARGYTVEEFHCASDPQSFDAVRIVERATVLLDGTAPHTIDPLYPGISGETLNLGIFKDKDAFAAQKAEVEAIAAQNRRAYTEAYAALAAASALQTAARDGVRSIEKTAFARAEKLLAAESAGDTRSLFIASATPCGSVDYLCNYAGSERIEFAGFAGLCALNDLAKRAAGKAVTRFADFITPSDTFALWLPSARALLCRAPAEEDGFAGAAQAQIGALTALANDSLKSCLALHDRIEEIYRPFVDYAAVSEQTERLLRKLDL